MINEDYTRRILLDIPFVSNITLHNEKTINGRTYQCAFNCDLLIHEDTVAVIVCIPDDWEQKLIDVFVKDLKETPFIPHIEGNGKICLFDLEGALIDLNFEGILIQCLTQAAKILDDGLHKNIDEEFIREFSSYWSYLPNMLNMKASIKNSNYSHLIKYIIKSPVRKEGQSYSQYYSEIRNSRIYASDDENYFSLKGCMGQRRNGLFCYIHPTNLVLPPDYHSELSVKYINNLLSLMDPISKKEKIQKCLNVHLIVCNITQPNQAETYIALIFKNGKLKLTPENRFKIYELNNFSLFPIYVDREDKSFLINRTDGGLYKNKKILLIGAGSIGGYMCNELVKAGLEDITIIDNDVLKAENIYRHLLGMEYVDQYKAEALCAYFSKNMPDVKLKYFDDNVIKLVNDRSIDLASYNLIISSVGDHNVNRWLNKEIYQRGINTQVIYEWNEPLDIGSHIAVVSRKYMGCYNCFFRRNNDDELYDAVAYTLPGQTVTKSMSGCGGSYIPYGSSTSSKTASIGMDLIRCVLDDRCNDNYLVSIKGEGFYFMQTGLQVSTVYTQQRTEVMTQRISDLTNGEGCDICGR